MSNETLIRKSLGQVAYEADCAIEPCYGDGTKRRPWYKLDDVSAFSWERNPTVRAKPKQA